MKLAPGCVIVLGDIGVSAQGRFAKGDVETAFGPAWCPVPVFLFPGGSPSVPRHRLRVRRGDALLLFVSAASVTRETSATVAWLADALTTPDRPSGIVVLVDQPIWDLAPQAWDQVEGLLRGSPNTVHVLAGGTDRFSWWRSDNLQTFCLRPASPGPDRGVMADGCLPAALWGTLVPGAPEFQVIRPTDLVPPQVFARDLQIERMALMNGWSATPLAAGDPVTEVSLTNPTSHALSFTAEWVFRGGAVSVEPDILGFSLAPRQQYRQRFRLSAADGVPLKFTDPRLVLATASTDGLGRPVPVRLTVRPPVTMGGDVVRLSPEAVASGAGIQWPDGGYPLGDPSQFVTPGPVSGGANLVEGTLHVGETPTAVVVSLDIRRQPGVLRQAALYVDTRGRERGEYGPTERPMIVTVDEASAVLTEGASIDDVSTRWFPGPTGGRLDVRIGPGAFAGGELPRTLFLDVVLDELDASGTVIRSLCFSGKADCRSSSELYAVFRRSVTESVKP